MFTWLAKKIIIGKLQNERAVLMADVSELVARRSKAENNYVKEVLTEQIIDNKEKLHAHYRAIDIIREV